MLFLCLTLHAIGWSGTILNALVFEPYEMVGSPTTPVAPVLFYHHCPNQKKDLHMMLLAAQGAGDCGLDSRMYVL